MASTLLTLLALVAASGFAHAQTYPLSIFSGGSGSSGSGSQASGMGSSGGGYQTPGSGSGSSSGGSSMSSMLGMPQEVISSGFGEFPGFIIHSLPFPIGGSSSGGGTGSSSGGSGFPQSLGTEMYNNIFGGRGTGDSGTGSSSGGQLIQYLVSRQAAFYRQSKQAAYCEQACKRALPASGLNRVLSSARQGAAHGHKERHGGRSSLPQHTRQNNGCPFFCHDLLSAQGSSTGNSVGHTGEFGTSASGSGGSHTGSQGTGGRVDGSTGGSGDSSNGK